MPPSAPVLRPDPGPLPSLGPAHQRRLVDALCGMLRAQDPSTAVELIETHISFVLLVGERAYKIKKALDLGFLDFTTAAKRRFCCDEELRLNRRTAPDLYLAVLPIVGSITAPRIGGDGPVLDWALQMRAFAQDGLWDRLAARGALGGPHIDALAEALAAFHRGAAVAPPDAVCGQPATVRAPVQDTLNTLIASCGAPADAGHRAALQALAAWEAEAFAGLATAMRERLAGGFVRECHGDLHLGNVTQVEGRTTLFDCLEFNPALRWTDVASDVAFMAMDLHAHGLPSLAHRFVNAYVEASGDLALLRVLRYHAVYRALVRAKIAALRREQPGTDREADTRTMARYLGAATALGRPAARAMVITHGFSGSGKTRATQCLLERCGAIRLRSDVERKRLHGLAPLASTVAAGQPAIYSRSTSEATYAHLCEGAARVLGAGYPVILDATFLARAERDRVRSLAARLGVPFVIADFQASHATLRARIERRMRSGRDASEADLGVLESQRRQAEPLAADEQPHVFAFDAEPDLDEAAIAARWEALPPRFAD